MLADLLKPGLSGAPVIIELVATFVGLTLATWFGKRQISQGKSEGQDQRPPMTFAGALSEQKADQLILAFNKNTAALEDNSASVGELKTSLVANTTAIVSVGGELSDNRLELRLLNEKLASVHNRS